MKFVIEGFFLTQPMSGIQRYSTEILLELDKIANDDVFELLVPEWYKGTISFKNIRIRYFGIHRKAQTWRQIDLCRYARKRRLPIICFSNYTPFLYRNGYVVVHDIYFKDGISIEYERHRMPYLKNLLWLRILLHRFSYWVIAKSKLKIITVSEFSKEEIIKYYKVDSNRVSVIPCAWQHMDKIEEDSRFLEKYPEIHKDEYFSSIGISGRKNFKWIVDFARKNPNSKIIVAGGKKYLNANPISIPDNLILPGRISDEEAKNLIINSKAFLFPSLYEGFGVPPLEALALGVPIIVSDIPVMHEVYGNDAYYVDPSRVDDDDIIGINEYLDFQMRDASGTLEKYSWKESARKLLELVYNGE